MLVFGEIGAPPLASAAPTYSSPFGPRRCGCRSLGGRRSPPFIAASRRRSTPARPGSRRRFRSPPSPLPSWRSARLRWFSPMGASSSSPSLGARFHDRRLGRPLSLHCRAGAFAALAGPPDPAPADGGGLRPPCWSSSPPRGSCPFVAAGIALGVLLHSVGKPHHRPPGSAYSGSGSASGIIGWTEVGLHRRRGRFAIFDGLAALDDEVRRRWKSGLVGLATLMVFF